MTTLGIFSALIAVVSLLFSAAWFRPGRTVFVTLSVTYLLDVFGIAVNGFNAGGVTICFDDIACVVVLVTGFLVLIRRPGTFLRDSLPCVLLLALAGLDFVRGALTYGFKPAGNDSRDILTFLAPCIAIMLLRPTLRFDTSRVARWIAGAGFCLSAIALARWAGILPMPVEQLDNLREVPRVLNADCACLVTHAFIASVFLALVERRSRWWLAAGMFGAITVALQHRSVWSATIVGIAWLMLRNSRRISPVRWFLLVGGAVIAVGLIMVAAPQVLGSASNLISTNVNEAESKDSTWEWRVKGYEEAGNRFLASGPVEMLIGPPAGWSVNSVGSFASIHIHSRYVYTLATNGIVGVLLLFAWFWTLARRIRKPNGRRYRGAVANPGSTLLEALLVSEVVYQIPYGGGMMQTVVLGLIWVAAHQSGISAVARRVVPLGWRVNAATNYPAAVSALTSLERFS